MSGQGFPLSARVRAFMVTARRPFALPLWAARDTLTYHSTDPNFDGSFRKLKFEVRRPDAQVVSRPGFYAISHDTAVFFSPEDKKLLASFASAAAQPASRKQNAPAGASRSCIQLYSVTVFQGNVDDEIVEEVRRLVKAAEDAGGGKSDEHDVLDKLRTNVTTLASQDDEYDPGTQNTWGVGGLKSGNGVYQVTVGKGAWADALGTKDHLGTRASTCHAEMTIVEERPGVQAIYSTQDCCLFRYGYLASRGYQRPPLRTNPWPKTGWTHPQNNFRLMTGSSVLGAVIKITFNGDTRYFQVFQT
jgi:hypothetical protein